MRPALLSWPRIAVLSLAVGCAGYHTVEPYRTDLEAAWRLEERAARICSAMRPGSAPPARRFVTDGCTGFPDGERVACCVEHDIPYWCGGSREQRREADARFGSCVTERDSAALGRLLGSGVRVTGHPLVPTGWRWGFGRPYPDGYDEAAAGELPER